MPTSPIRLADYRPPAWTIRHVVLEFDLDAAGTEVLARLQLQPQGEGEPLRLQGDGLQTLSVQVDGETLPATAYRIDTQGLHLPGVRQACELTTRARIRPDANSRLEGLYASRGMLFTQCEAEGFRRITWFIDRPDVLATWEVILRADRARFPVLLSNGNPAGAGELPDGRHWARWVDPHPKPSYLFAVAAGVLGSISADFRTEEGREVRVNIWAEPADVPRCRHALDSALAAMRWDEVRFGRCYDLEVYNIVAAQDFTMGAMENKGLNIFNARYILADAESATDNDFAGIEAVIGHEYFHNWSGNRVTLRDWFQLSLKEGLTVFRDQEFTADRHSRGLKRIEDARLLKSRQFVEDSGPLAHPVRPAEYQEINNFYTATVYEKGAEVVRMLHTLLGESGFRQGMDVYFARHDGHAATVEDFLAAMAEASGRDLGQFQRWYAQAGTPELLVREHWDAARGEYTLHVEQSGHAAEPPLHIPLALRLYDETGGALHSPDECDADYAHGILELRQKQHRAHWRGLQCKPLPVFLQALSAPVRLRFPYDAPALGRLVRLERDPLSRWEAMQQLAQRAIVGVGADADSARSVLLDAAGLLLDDRGDPAFVAECLDLPDFATLADACTQIDLDGLVRAREDLLDLLAETHTDALEACYLALQAQTADALTPTAIAARRLKSVCLDLLTRLDPEARLANQQFERAQVMTDRLMALRCLLHYDAPTAGPALARFRERWRDDLLVTDKWLALVAMHPQPEAVESVAELLRSELWLPRNPNRVRAVLGSFARNNPVALHRRDGAGYALLFEQIVALDAINPQVAARLLAVLEYWRRLDAQRVDLIDAGLRAVARRPLSNDLGETLSRLRA